MNRKSHVSSYLADAKKILERLDCSQIEKMVRLLSEICRKGGRLFFLGVGGSAANASHAVNDFRKIVGIESYTPTDNVAELTARINDDGWRSSYAEWLRVSRLNKKDGVFVLSVGGGSLEKDISTNLVSALRYAKKVRAKVFGIVGRDGGYTKKAAHACVLVPTVNQASVTPQTEAFQSVVLHLLVSHPALQRHQMKWESIKRQ